MPCFQPFGKCWLYPCSSGWAILQQSASVLLALFFQKAALLPSRQTKAFAAGKEDPLAFFAPLAFLPFPCSLLLQLLLTGAALLGEASSLALIGPCLPQNHLPHLSCPYL